MLRGLGADDVDVFQAGPAIKPQIGQILAEKSKAFSKKKNRDQRQNDDRDERVTAEKGLDRRFRC